MENKKQNEEVIEARERFVSILQTLRAKKLLTEAGFMRLLHASPAYVRNFTANMAPKTRYKFEKIFPFINMEYIETGSGDMFTHEPTKEDIAMSRRVSEEVKIEFQNNRVNLENSMNQVGGDMYVAKESEIVAVLKAKIASLEQERDYLRQQCNTLLDIISKKS